MGRFLQVDPVQGGTLNNYVYATDAVNDFDLDGSMIATPMQRNTPLLETASYKIASACNSSTWCVVAATVISIAIPGTQWAGGMRAVAGGKAGSQIALNAARGANAERLAAIELRFKNPFASIQKQVRVNTPEFGAGTYRRIDYLVTNHLTKKVVAYEVKAGKAVYGGAQKAKDKIIERTRGVITKVKRYRWL